MTTYCTLKQDANLQFQGGDGGIVTDALARVPNKTAVVLTDVPGREFEHPENFNAHLRHVMRHGGTLIVEQRLDDGFLGLAIYGVRFSGPFMTILSPNELKTYRSSGVIYGDFEEYL